MIPVVAAFLVIATLGPVASERARRPAIAPPGRAGRRARAGKATGPARRRRLRRTGIGAGVVGATLLDPLLAVAVVVGVVGRRPLTRAFVRRSRRRAVDRSAADAIDLLVLVVRAGLTPHQAVRVLASRGPDACREGFVRVVRRVDHGAALADALSALTDELGPRFASVADTLASAERRGTPLSSALDQLAADARRHRRAAADAAARALPVRLAFPLVCCVLPAFVLVAIAPAVLAALSSLGDTSW